MVCLRRASCCCGSGRQIELFAAVDGLPGAEILAHDLRDHEQAGSRGLERELASGARDWMLELLQLLGRARRTLREAFEIPGLADAVECRTDGRQECGKKRHAALC